MFTPHAVGPLILLCSVAAYDIIIPGQTPQEKYVLHESDLIHSLPGSRYFVAHNVTCFAYDYADSLLYWQNGSSLFSFRGQEQGDCHSLSLPNGTVVLVNHPYSHAPPMIEIAAIVSLLLLTLLCKWVLDNRRARMMDVRVPSTRSLVSDSHAS